MAITDTRIRISAQDDASPAFATVADNAGRMQNALRGSVPDMDRLGVSAKQTAAAMRGIPAQMTDIVTSLQGGQALWYRNRWIRSTQVSQALGEPPKPGPRHGSDTVNTNVMSIAGKAWALVDEAGCRGLALGGAQVSEKHTNFLINAGDATSADIEALGEEVRRRVKDKSGVELEWEIRRVGVSK